MKLERIKELRKALEDENISMSELAEIQEAFDVIPDHDLREDRDNAMISDMLDELQDRTYTYFCENETCKNKGVELPDTLFPTEEEIKQGMNPGWCLNCNKDNETN